MHSEFSDNADDRARKYQREWQKMNGLRKSSMVPCLSNLVGNRARCCTSVYPAFDHMTLWNRNGKPAVLTSHAYPLSGEDMKDLIEKCESIGVDVKISAHSWYSPRATILIEMWAPGVRENLKSAPPPTGPATPEPAPKT